ncbi:MAG: GntR family transcriptional regulator [Capsulimonadaceae bacterium]|nr:GntR family transcriptional regulator [Capsulimonadaceae bacterium]
MKSVRSNRGRTPVKKDHVARELRQQILSGKLQPGDRVPTRTDLEEAFQTSTATVQSALDDLVRDGFVRVEGRRGTFVTQDLPFLTRYGFVFPRDPATTAEWPRFFTAIANEVLRANMTSGIQLPIYAGVNNPKSDGYRELEHDVLTRRLAGLVFVSESAMLTHKPLIEEAGLPVVRIADIPGLPAPWIMLDGEAYIDKALDYFLQKGKRRVAVLALHDWIVERGEYLRTALAKRGMETRSYWTQGFHYTLTASTRNCTELLLRSRTLDPFDALLISDDNIVSAAAEGIAAAGDGAAQGLEVIAHCNFPPTDAVAMPIKRLGFDVRRIVAECVRSIDQQRDGGDYAQCIRIPPMFDHELPRN